MTSLPWSPYRNSKKTEVSKDYDLEFTMVEEINILYNSAKLKPVVSKRILQKYISQPRRFDLYFSFNSITGHASDIHKFSNGKETLTML